MRGQTARTREIDVSVLEPLIASPHEADSLSASPTAPDADSSPGSASDLALCAQITVCAQIMAVVIVLTLLLAR